VVDGPVETGLFLIMFKMIVSLDVFIPARLPWPCRGPGHGLAKLKLCSYFSCTRNQSTAWRSSLCASFVSSGQELRADEGLARGAAVEEGTFFAEGALGAAEAAAVLDEGDVERVDEVWVE
jgi:hypothetical protein